MITHAPIADVCLVFAKTNAKLGSFSLSAFLIDKGTPGLEATGLMPKMGLRSSPIGDLFFQDCFVPEENRLGPEGAGGAIFHDSMEWERGFILASHVGAMERQLAQAFHYSQQRRQFNQPIDKFQSVSHRLANMRLRLECARLMLYKIAWLKEQGKSVAQHAAMVKLLISEAFVESSMDALRIYGGYGYMTEMGVEKNLRDAVGGTLYSGTSDIQRNIIASLLDY
jgi:alkylation response protein AidB-like acyl-CoA dehydrogenase